MDPADRPPAEFNDRVLELHPRSQEPESIDQEKELERHDA
jgi:hypothetical protein